MRGAGSKVTPFTGTYEGNPHLGFFARRRKEREAQTALRKAIREEQIAKEMARRRAIRLKRITEQERVRAREGGFFTRSFKSALKQARKELKG